RHTRWPRDWSSDVCSSDLQRALEWSLLHRRRVVGATVGLFAVALISVPFLGTEFMPKLDEGYLLIETRRIQSASLPHGIAVSDEIGRASCRERADGQEGRA